MAVCFLELAIRFTDKHVTLLGKKAPAARRICHNILTQLKLGESRDRPDPWQGRCEGQGDLAPVVAKTREIMGMILSR